jgi:hypothetical protein
MIRAGCLEKRLKVIHELPHLAFKIMLDSGNELLIGVTGALIVISLIAASGDHDSMG